MKPWKTFGAVIAVCIIAALIYLLDPGRLWVSLSSAPRHLVAIGVVLVQVQIVLSALRWRAIAGRLDQHIPLRTAIGSYYISTLLNQLLPGGMAGDALRAANHRHDTTGGLKTAVTAVVFERLSGQIALFGLAACSCLFWRIFFRSPIPEPIVTIGVTIGSILAVLAGIMVLAACFGPAGLKTRLRVFGPSLHRVYVARGAWFIQGTLSGMIVMAYAAVFFIASDAVGAPLPPLALFTIIPLCLLAMLLPTTIAGWGAREAAAVLLWPVIGFTAANGFSASILYGIISLVGALPGVVFLIARRIGRRNDDRLAAIQPPQVNGI